MLFLKGDSPYVCAAARTYHQRILVTGGAGFLGRQVIDQLCVAGADLAKITIPWGDKTIPVWGDGSPTREFLYSTDAARDGAGHPVLQRC